MQALSTLCGGFLLAVLWFDLMFDTAAARHAFGRTEIPQSAVDVIAAYYRRATIESYPMNLLVAAVMLGALVLAVLRLALSVDEALWQRVLSVGLVAVPVVVARVKTVPEARRLGMQADGLDVQRKLAASILIAHLAFFAAILLFVALQF